MAKHPSVPKSKKKKTGRPQIEIDWTLVGNLCQIQCTQEEIASIANCSVDTLDRASKRDHKVSFAEFLEEKAHGGRASIRRSQWKLANSGNAVMLIWLGKQYLGQRDEKQPMLGDPQGVARGIRDMVGALFAVAK